MFSEILKKARKNKGITQSELAQKLNLTQQAVGKWERGLAEPDISSITKIARILDCSVEYLLGETIDPAPKSTQKKPLSLEEIEAMYLQALIDNDIVKPGKPVSDETLKRLEDSVRLAIRIATEQALKDEKSE